MTTPASAAEWNGSYSANGQCFCVGAIPKAVQNAIVPTPIGGQTVAQVCRRVGAGPGLSKVDELFNYPVFTDAQCGHGPFPDDQATNAANCAGTLDGKAANQSESCQPAGPSWDLKAAFAKKPKVAAAAPQTPSDSAVNDTTPETPSTGLLSEPVVTTLSIPVDSADGETKPALKATVISSASTAARKLPDTEPLPSFTGKNVTISGQRYLQARDGLDATGGAPGSRIILDGLVFLRDDGSIEPEDLYREQTQTAQQPSAAPAPARQVSKKLATVAPDDADVQATNRQIERQKQLAKRQAAERQARQAEATAQAQAIAEAEALRQAKQRLDQQAARRAKEQALARQAALSELPATTPLSAYAADDLDAKAARNARTYSRARIAIPDSPLSIPADATDQAAVTEAAAQVEATNSKSDAEHAVNSAPSAVLSALRLPPQVRASSRDFSYLEALPASFDIGGNGIVLEGSAQSHSRIQYMGRVGVTASYQELMVGAGYYLTPNLADRLTVVLLAGVEYGSFELTDDQDPSIAVDFNDTGVYLGAATRFVANNRFELKAGLGYSTFFEGDAMIFGGGYYHMTPSLDLVSRFELGDNDLLGIGVRFYY